MRWTIENLGECAWLAKPVDLPPEQTLAQILAAAQALGGEPRLRTVHAGAHSLLLECDVGQTLDPLALLAQLGVLAPAQLDARRPGRTLEVCFDGIDLEEVAGKLGLASGALRAALCATDLEVAMLGFLPGFAYLRGLPPSLSLPRRSEPRARVPGGSLALGGSYLGVYPCAAPGGWHLLGSVAAPMFDPCRSPPATLSAGMRLRLVDRTDTHTPDGIASYA